MDLAEFTASLPIGTFSHKPLKNVLMTLRKEFFHTAVCQRVCQLVPRVAVMASDPVPRDLVAR